jgi:hypothetical protein
MTVDSSKPGKLMCGILLLFGYLCIKVNRDPIYLSAQQAVLKKSALIPLERFVVVVYLWIIVPICDLCI